MPRDAVAVSLLDALSETGFQSSVIATYSCYFPFYEDVILRRLLDRGCTNNVLLVDAGLCADAFSSDTTRPRRAGRDYTLVPVQLHGAFHPKLIVALGKMKGALFVGSHNATLAGFGLNDEVTNVFRTSGAGARQGAGPIRAALDYLQGFVPSELADVTHVFGAVRKNVPWLDGPVPVESTDRDLLTTTGSDTDLWSRIRPLVPRRPTTAFVCGPFFDSNLTFLRRLVDEAEPRRLIVGIDPESVEIDPAAARGLPEATFVNISGIPRVPNRRSSGARYLHAKALWFTSTDGELLVTGSANPSQAALLASSQWRNAEAVVVDRRAGAAEALGLGDLVAAPVINAEDWTRVAERHAERADIKEGVRGTVVLAVPADEGFRLERAIGAHVRLEANALDGTGLGSALTAADDQLRVEASDVVRDEAQALHGFTSRNQPVVVLIHRPDEIARNVGGDRQRELRQALGALEEDPAQLETLLKLTEKVIFDSNDIVKPEPALRPQAQGDRQEAAPAALESLAVDAAGRRGARKKKRLASGDILVLVDALMHRLGEGLLTPPPTRVPAEEVLPVDDDDAGEDDRPREPPPYEGLAGACRGKMGRLIRRMVKQLEAARTGPAARAVVQLASVLSVVHTLRTMEQRTEWRSQHLKLVDPDQEWLLLEAGGLALGWSASSLGPRAIVDGHGEPFQELSLATGLLAWLAWETGIDVTAAPERTSPIDIKKRGDDPWYRAQVFASLAGQLAGDAEARDILKRGVQRTARKGMDSSDWVARHLRLASRFAAIVADPESATSPRRAARPGDLVVLGAALDPRVRVVLKVAPSGSSDRVTVFDEVNDGGQRQFVTSHVRWVEWWSPEAAPRQVKGA